ncbi:MAG: DUF4242 domain-containing protein [Acidobacteriia bacterium]|nr:DUF4242 domain-containing protein [Terriglobia bacterium]
MSVELSTAATLLHTELLFPKCIEIYSGFEKACEEVGGADLGAHVNVAQGKAYCFTKGPDAEAIRRAHEKLNFPFDSITEVRRVTGVDLRPEESKKK